MGKYSVDIRYSHVLRVIYVSFIPSNNKQYDYSYIWQNDDVDRWGRVRRHWIDARLPKRMAIRNLALNKRSNRGQAK